MSETDPTGYVYSNSNVPHTHAYLLPTVFRELATVASKRSFTAHELRIFEIGCGNGSTAAVLAKHSYPVIGVDPSLEGIQIANTTFPDIKLEVGSCYDDLAARYGRFPVVISLEVVEHIFLPRKFAKCLYDMLEPGGTALFSTPYHSYWKNLVLAITGKMDNHFTALWDYGHIKFWSRRTITTLLEEAGLQVERFARVGRIPALAKSMIVIARRPAKS